MTEATEEPRGDESFALRLTEALEAISAAQTDSHVAPITDEPVARNAERGTVTSRWLGALDKLPPIRLPVGPAIPWRLGLPALVGAVILMGVMSRSSAHADPVGVQLPAQQTYAVQQEAPLFAKPQPTEMPAAAQPLGVQDPAAPGFDIADLGIKLVAVLGLAYGSLALLKRTGFGGASSSSRSGGMGPGVRVVSSLALAPNRSVHVIKVPGGRTLLVGATPNAVNLIADLGDAESTQYSPAAAGTSDCHSRACHLY